MSNSFPLLPGDPEGISKYVAQYRTTAEAIAKVTTDLNTVSNGAEFESEAIVKIRGRASDAAAVSALVYERYTDTTEILGEYANALAKAQNMAKVAISNYQALEAEVAALEHKSKQFADDLLQGGPGALAALKLGAQAEAELIEMGIQLKKIATEYATAAAMKELAVQTAIDSIVLSMGDSSLDDTPLDVIADAVETAYKWAQQNLAPILEKILSVAQDLLNILSTVSAVLNLLALIPGLDAVFGPLAAIADIAVTILSVVAIASTVMLVLLGKRSVGQVVSAAISLAAQKLLGKLGGAVAGKLDGAIGAEEGSFVAKGVDDAVDKFMTDPLQDKVDKTVSEPAGDWADNQHLQLFPSSSSQPWNAPPTIHVDPVSLPSAATPQDIAATVGDAASGHFSSMGTAGSQPVLVSAAS
ncbi:MAG TPA: hypothetical protein VHU90_07750 [Galbitalea sp.]|nr:hypothetical protein [Galbitalea sp.]